MTIDVAFGLASGFIGHLRLVTTIHYGVLANSHILEYTRAHTTS
jgi:hypothetical protein